MIRNRGKNLCAFRLENRRSNATDIRYAWIISHHKSWRLIKHRLGRLIVLIARAFIRFHFIERREQHNNKNSTIDQWKVTNKMRNKRNGKYLSNSNRSDQQLASHKMYIVWISLSLRVFRWTLSMPFLPMNDLKCMHFVAGAAVAGATALCHSRLRFLSRCILEYNYAKRLHEVHFTNLKFIRFRHRIWGRFVVIAELQTSLLWLLLKKQISKRSKKKCYIANGSTFFPSTRILIYWTKQTHMHTTTLRKLMSSDMEE